MQRLLIGDPIQFAKTGTSSKVLQKLKETNIQIQEIVNNKKASSKELDKLTDLIQEKADLLEQYNKDWARTDANETYANQAKRLAGDNASGEIIITANGKTSFNLLIVKDLEMPSNYIDEYIKMYVDKPLSKEEEKTLLEKYGENDKNITLEEAKRKQAERILAAYRNINTADAQELTTLKEFLDIRVAQNTITQEEADRIKADDGLS